MARTTCIRCAKDLPSPKTRKDDYCTARCKREHNTEYYKDLNRSKRADPDHGWF